MALHVNRALRQIVLPYAGKSRASPSAAWIQPSSDTPSPDVGVVSHCAPVAGSRLGGATYYNCLVRHGIRGQIRGQTSPNATTSLARRQATWLKFRLSGGR